ncbi:efflux RND transporter periplasmic adaptor subunit [uncultured Sphingomonas sp.]|uniref:efflux RND transporter periplasmic adaptor subunit n=1 Tax=uncultured Sphingomonas sp. TaxID=158754 RepID=UPI0035CBC299
MTFKRPGWDLGIAALLLTLAACGRGDGEAQGKGAPGPMPVGVVTLREEPVTLTVELPGRTTAFETSEVRPQVNGLVRARLFTEGDYVRQGQALYRIDAAPYEAQVASARAALSRARAGIASSAALARRYGELVGINAIARQEYENAQTASNQAGADVAAQSAALRSAQIDLARTTITAPISGRIGRSTFTTGALVSAAQAEPLATIQRLDPVYVDIQQASTDLLRLREQIVAGGLTRGGAGGARVRLRLETGSLYPREGVLRFADVTVDPATGSQTIRATFGNPNGLLLPGMFVRAELVEGVQGRAILVPQRAVTRNERGQPTVMVVGRGDLAELRPIQASRTVGANWLVTGGVRPGDRVIVEGAMMLRPGMPVRPRPWTDRPAARPAVVGAPAAQAK